jgi:uroporphyrin-III C-methyltransferase/precorrin-2 dehydrogenase/sirohydrochlorin ferrochelatase
MGTLPILLKNPSILLIGGGKVALHKAQILFKNDINFTIIASKLCPELAELNIPRQIRPFATSDLDNIQIVIDATGNPDVAQNILIQKKQKNILFNCVDQPELCDFYFCSLLSYGSLKIAVSTGGDSPTIGQVVRDKIAEIIPDEIEQLLKEKRQQRKQGMIDVAATREQCDKLFRTGQN